MNNVITEVNVDDINKISSTGYIGNDLAVFESIDSTPIRSYPVKLNIAMMVVCTRGTGKIEINLHTYDVSEGDLLLMLPRQIVQIVEEKDIRAFAVAVSPNYMESVAPIREKLLSLFLKVGDNPVLRITREEIDDLKEYYDFLYKCLNDTKNVNRLEIVRGIAYATLFNLGGVITNHLTYEPKKISRKEEILNRFLKLLADNYYTEKSVTFYADKLFVNPKHLTTVVKELSGKTASEWIIDYVILESKMLLKNTNLTVSQIAQKLNFNNQSFFGKYFKQHVGMSPISYRNS